MNFTHFLESIPKINQAQLGGLKIQLEMAPEMRKQFSQEKILASNPKESAVLALFYPDVLNETRFLLTQRAIYKGTHSAQVSLPGGKKDNRDENLIQTAKRETEEEVGISKNEIIILKQLTRTYIPPSNFLVTPYMGYINITPVFKLNHEVESIIEVKLKDLLDDSNIMLKTMSTSYMDNIDVPCFNLNDYIVWGATAMILNEIKCLLKSI
jgi:8-oxo-dGTP pyrophosphatase MutT (NUDIX family)